MFSRTSSGISGDLYKQSSKSHSTVFNWRCNPASHGITRRTSEVVRTAGSQRCSRQVFGQCFIVTLALSIDYKGLMTNVIQLNMHGARVKCPRFGSNRATHVSINAFAILLFLVTF